MSSTKRRVISKPKAGGLEVLESSSAPQQQPSKPQSAGGAEDRSQKSSNATPGSSNGRSASGGFQRSSMTALRLNDGASAPSSSSQSLSSSSLVRSLVTDVVTARRLHATDFDGCSPSKQSSLVPTSARMRTLNEAASSSGSKGNNRPGSSASTAAGSVVSTTPSMSLASVARTERSLGRTLPTDEAGQHVILTRGDLERLQDPETLQFLQEHSELFSKYTKADSGDTPSGCDVAGGGEGKPRYSASDIQQHVDALYSEIETFITAVDFEGNSYHIHLDECGELRVPLAGSDNDYGALQSMLLSGGADGDGERLLVTEEDLANFDAEFGLSGQDEQDETGGDTDNAMYGGLDDDLSNVDNVSAPVSSSPPATPGTSESTPASSDAGHQPLQLVRRPLLEKLLDAGTRQRLHMIIKHHAGGPKPRYMATTEARRQQQQVVTAEGTSVCDNSGGSSVPTPVPPPARTAGGFSVQYCSAALGAVKTAAGVEVSAQRGSQGSSTHVIRPQRQTLSAHEERRVQFILDNDDWEKGVMGENPLHGTTEKHHEDSDARSSLSTGSVASSSLLAYDEASTTSYAAGSGGYTVAPALASKLESIEERLDLLQRARLAQVAAEVAAAALGSEAAPAHGASPVPSARSTGNVPSMAPRSAARSAATLSEPQPALEAEAEAQQKRKQIGNGYLAAVREEQQQRRQLSELNDRLQRLHETMDELVTPPFAFNTTYEMTASPATWQWPESAPPPTPDQLASLLAEARAEDVRFAQAVAAMEKKKKETKTKGINHGTVVEEEFGDEDIDGAPPGTFSATVAPTVTPATTGATRVAEPTPFLANLRARFEEAMNIAKELDTHEYHRPEDVRIDPEDVTGAAVDEDEVPSAL